MIAGWGELGVVLAEGAGDRDGGWEWNEERAAVGEMPGRMRLGSWGGEEPSKVVRGRS